MHWLISEAWSCRDESRVMVGTGSEAVAVRGDTPFQVMDGQEVEWEVRGIDE